ncbi:hypothetical protein ACHAXR_000781, partial [Thalassiosira sp. AJA248-18]
MIGHYDTWLIDLWQRLVQINHNITLYPNWSNASDLVDTAESLDTVALHDEDLHQALENRCARIDSKKIKLTREQKFLCQAQGVKLPFLPFTKLEEKKLYSRHYSIISKKTEHEASIWWCNHVDGVNIFPKLPVHFRMHHKKWLKKNRIENSVKAAKKGAEKLREINVVLSPSNPHQPTSPAAKSAAASNSFPNTNTQSVFPTEIKRPPAMPQPHDKALHNRSHTIVGGTMIGFNPGTGVPQQISRGRDKTPRSRRCKKCEDSKMYENDSEHKCAGSGGGGERCDYFGDSGRRRCWRCMKFGNGVHQYDCPATYGHRDD